MLREWYESGTKVVREWYGSGTGVLREWCERAWGDVLDVSTSATLDFGRTTLLKKSKISRIVFGGFELDTPKATIQNRLWVILNQTNGYSEVEVLLATSKGIHLCHRPPHPRHVQRWRCARPRAYPAGLPGARPPSPPSRRQGEASRGHASGERES